MKNAIAICLLLLLAAPVPAVPARAAKPAFLQERIKLVNAHREMFARGDFARLDKGMKDMQRRYEKGEWKEDDIMKIFTRPFSGPDGAFEYLYDQWVAAHPKSYAAHQARGLYLAAVAFARVEAAGGEAGMSQKDMAAVKALIDKAVADNTAAAKLAEKPLLAYAKLVDLYGHMGSLDKSRRVLDRANAAIPRNVMARREYMKILGRAGGKITQMKKFMDDVRASGLKAAEINEIAAPYHFALLKEGRYAELDEAANRVQREYEDGNIDDVDLYNYSVAIAGVPDSALEEKFNGWVRKFPRSYAARQARSTYSFNVGYEARGSKYYSDTSEAEKRGFRHYMEKSLADADAALSLTEKPILTYDQLMSIARSYGGLGISEAQILDRAIAIDPDNHIVRFGYYFGLQGRWGGSLEEMQAFVRTVGRSELPEDHLYRYEDMILTEIEWIKYNTLSGLKEIGQLQTGF